VRRKRCVWCNKLYEPMYHYEGKGFCSKQCGDMYRKSKRSIEMAKKGESINPEKEEK